jgi:hypothetical protein
MHREWTKDPQARRRFTWDWVQLTNGTDPVATATVTAVADAHADGAPGDLTIDSLNVDAAGRLVSARVAGGTHGKRYALLCHVDTTGGQIDEHTAFLLVQNE